MAQRWCNRPEEVITVGREVMANDAELWLELRRRVDAVEISEDDAVESAKLTAEIERLRDLINTAACYLEAGSDRGTRLHWAKGLRELRDRE